MPGDDAKVALIQANEESERLLHAEVNEYHLLLGLLHVEDSAAARALRKFGVDPVEVRRRLMQKGEGGVYRPEGVISSFYGIEIRLDWRDELQPTFVASYKEFVAKIATDCYSLVMATTVTLNSDLIEEVKRITGKPTKAEAVREALVEYVRSRRRGELLELEGKLPFNRTNEQIEAAEDEERPS
jgi:Arc/MetJ family transcription regulator